MGNSMSSDSNIIKQIYINIRKDLTIEVRRGYEYLSSLAFIIASSLVISHIITKFLRVELFIPSLWIIIVFLGIFTTYSSFVREVDKKTIYGVRLLPIPAPIIFLSKSLYTYILVFTQSIVYLGFQTLFTMSTLKLSMDIVYTLIIFSLNISIIASFTSALVMYSEGRSFLIPMLIFIFSLPIIPLAVAISDPEIPAGPFDLPLLAMETFTLFITFTILSEYLLET
ncbi:MAG TPA: hypothetical protein EYH44_00100 [Thermoprotei archaeon]|nr:hypothetical protein [Thermoprotei archaeon]